MYTHFLLSCSFLCPQIKTFFIRVGIATVSPTREVIGAVNWKRLSNRFEKKIIFLRIKLALANSINLIEPFHQRHFELFHQRHYEERFHLFRSTRNINASEKDNKKPFSSLQGLAIQGVGINRPVFNTQFLFSTFIL